MKLTRVDVGGFRNLADIHYEPASKINAFFGENAQGKTNFLEAIYITLRGDSFRYYSNRKDWLTNQSTLNAKVSLVTELGTQHSCELKTDDRGPRLYLNDKKISSSQLKPKHPIVVFSPDDHTLVRGEPQIRRLFGEEVLADGVPGFGEVLSDYSKALKNKNALLKQIRDLGLTNDLKRQNEHWNLILAQNGTKLAALREEAWPMYQKIFTLVVSETFHSQTVDMRWKTFESPQDLNVYVDNLRKSFDKDLATGWTHFGIHRDDIEISVDNLPARTSASQGQARMLAMALRWSHADWIRERSFEEPVFFVDDFSSELDTRHRELLLARLLQTSGQVFLTGTNESFLDPNLLANSTKTYIVNGRVLERNSYT